MNYMTIPGLSAELRPHSGWKLHLNFDPTNAQHVQNVEAVLNEFLTNGRIAEFKIASGGGVMAGHLGKEATVYVGDFDSMLVIAEELDERLGTVLLENDPDVIAELSRKSGSRFAPSSDAEQYFDIDTLRDDIPALPYTTKIMARFDVWPNPEFSEYGRHGIPLIAELDRALKTDALYGTKPTVAALEEATDLSKAKLTERFGSLFSGTSQRFESWYESARLQKQQSLTLFATNASRPLTR